MRRPIMLLVVAAAACRSKGDASMDAGAAAAAALPPPTASGPLVAATADASVAEDTRTITGQWERRTEPYKGMRIEIRANDPTVSVTAAPGAGDADAGTSTERAQLACRRSLWKPGDAYITKLHEVGKGYDGTVLVRDWGLVGGQCRHQDSSAPARVTLQSADTLAIVVLRGKNVTQWWTRVR